MTRHESATTRTALALRDARGVRALWRALDDLRPIYLLAVALLAVALSARSGTFLLLRAFVDDVLVASVSGPVADAAARTWTTALVFVALAIVLAVLTLIADALAARAAETTAERIRNGLHAHLLLLPFGYHDAASTGDLVQRATSDVDGVRRTLHKHTIGVGRVLLLFTVNVAALLAMNPMLTLVSLPAVPLNILLSFLFHKRISRSYEAMQAQDARMTTVLQENASGVRVVKAFARQEHEIDKFDVENRRRRRRALHLVNLHAGFWPASDMLGGTQMLVGLVVGATMAIAGTITIGTFVAYSGLIVWIIWPLRELGRLVVEVSKGAVSADRIGAVLRNEPELLEEKDEPDPRNIELSGEVSYESVSLRYPGAPADGAPVLEEVSFRCRAGEVVALLGHTGSGKTSVVNLLPRFYDYQEGSIELDGRRLESIPKRVLRQQIGTVDQEPLLFSASVRDNITYGVTRTVTDADVVAAAQAAAIHDVIDQLPDGYDTIVGERGVTLSGGQRQRVTIARTILRDPAILILDDSTSSVDIETEARIWSALQELMRGRTTFIIAHRVQSLMRADQILVMARGRVVQSGSHADLLAGGGLYRELYQLQMGETA